MRKTAATMNAPSGKQPRDWHALSPAETAARLASDLERGLSAGEASRRLAEHGPNALVERGGRGAARILADQFASAMIALLAAAAAVSVAFGEYQDAGAIAAILLLNAGLGFLQEYRAQRALAALRLLSVPKVRARRSGRTSTIPASDLVPGDVVLVEAGNLVPADGRLIEAASLSVQESMLTGESAPIDKDPQTSGGGDIPLGDRTNLLYSGTAIARGRARFIVTETGMNTQLGRIAALLESAGRAPTPLQRRLNDLGRRLAVFVLAIAAAILAIGLLRGEPLRIMLMTAVSLAVAAVPEGLPAVVTIALAVGARRMHRRNALVRSLPAVEALGSVDVICADKTGTLSQGRMSVLILDAAGRRLELDTLDRVREADVERARSLLGEHPSLAALLWAGALCNDAAAELGPDGRPASSGDPVEAAILVAGLRHGLDKAALERDLPRVRELPFDSIRKRMTTVHRFDRSDADPFGPWRGENGRFLAITKGAVESVIAAAENAWDGRRIVALDEGSRRQVLRAHDELAASGMKVLALAARSWGELPAAEELESRLAFIGLIGLVDPPKPEAEAAVRTCQAAGIRPIMVTGDHPLTAAELARRVGIPPRDVFARISPEQKLTIVEELQKKGRCVAMTGDGVNDAPALRRADIGVAMGRGGTDVAKEASDIVLLDDDFSTIVAAVEEGRIVYDNIRKFLRYLLTTNAAEILVMLAAPLLGMPLPLLPLQILWINLVTDGPPALALALEPGEPDVMKRPPRPRSEGLLTGELGRHAAWASALMTALSLGAGWWYWNANRPEWRTMIFMTLAFTQIANVAAARSEREPLWRLGWRTNPWLAAAVAGAAGLQFLTVAWTPLREALGVSRLGWSDLAAAAGLAALAGLIIDLQKLLKRKALARTLRRSY